MLLLTLVIALAGCTRNPASFNADLDNLLRKAQQNGKIVMLELGSVGCISCDNMKPVMESLRRNYSKSLEVISVDVKEHRQIATRYGVYAIPVQVFLDRQGKEFHRHVGYYAYDKIEPVLKTVGI